MASRRTPPGKNRPSKNRPSKSRLRKSGLRKDRPSKAAPGNRGSSKGETSNGGASRGGAGLEAARGGPGKKPKSNEAAEDRKQAPLHQHARFPPVVGLSKTPTPKAQG